jgi:hypothetical protein
LNCQCAWQIRQGFCDKHPEIFQTAIPESPSEQNHPGDISIALAEHPGPKACGMEIIASAQLFR